MDISPFVESMNRAFSDLAEVHLINGPPEVRTGKEKLSDVSVNIALSGEVEASLVLTATEDAAVLLTRITTGKKEVKASDRLVYDALGEMLNTIAGNAQRISGKKFNFSLPVFIESRNSDVSSVFPNDFKRVVSRLQGGEIGLYVFG